MRSFAVFFACQLLFFLLVYFFLFHVFLCSYDALALKITHECPSVHISKVYRSWNGTNLFFGRLMFLALLGGIEQCLLVAEISADLKQDNALSYSVLWAGSWLYLKQWALTKKR